jgi:DNA polymerase-3 subunit delta'
MAAFLKPPDLLGNERQILQLGQLARQDRLHSCLLFEGPGGVGKTAVARWLAQVVNCADESMKPCGACWSCRQIAQGRHPDVISVGLDPERTAPIISVRQAREVIDQLKLRPAHARRRLVIFEPAECINSESGNALLKLLEEPPRETGFVLITTSAATMMVTIRSRSQRWRWAPVPRQSLRSWLVKREVAEPDRVAALSGGSPGAALRLAEGELAALDAALDHWIWLLGEPLSSWIAHAEKSTKGANRGEVTEELLQSFAALELLLRDALVAELGRGQPLLDERRAGLTRRWGRALGAPGLSRCHLALEQARRDLAAFVTPRMVLEGLIARLALELGPARLEGSPDAAL